MADFCMCNRPPTDRKCNGCGYDPTKGRSETVAALKDRIAVFEWLLRAERNDKLRKRPLRVRI